MPPRTIRELAEESRRYEFSPTISFRSWVHVAKTMLSQADVYHRERQYEQAYVLFSKFADLVINALPKHPEIKADPRAKKQLKALVQLVPGALERIQELKVTIEKSIYAYKVLVEEAKKSRVDPAKANAVAGSTAPGGPGASGGPGGLGPTGETTNRSSFSSSSASSGSEWSYRSLDPKNDPQFLETLSSLKRLRNDYKSAPPEPADWSLAATPRPVNWSYPSPPKFGDKPLPELPAQPTSPSPQTGEPVHKTRSQTEGGEPLRTVFLPAQLRQSFLEVAQPNTDKKLETCGILCGKLTRNAFFITHLVIPEQESTADTCATTDEASLFEYIDENDLFILGWIHTHPTQSCFLSSVDLHTQTSYQIMLPEAVAIVCAPKHDPSWGIFRLTDPPGVDIIKACRQSSTFHPHPEPDLYRPAYSQGHVVIRSSLPFTLKDQRA